MTEIGRQRGFTPPRREQYDHETRHGSLLVGDPEDIAERILALHEAMGHMRHFLQIDIGGLPQFEFLKAVELLGTKVKPLLDAHLGPEPTIVTP